MFALPLFADGNSLDACVNASTLLSFVWQTRCEALQLNRNSYLRANPQRKTHEQ